MGKANTDLGIARPDVGVASSGYGISEPWKELASFQTGIRGSDEQVTKPDQGGSQFREENSQTPEGIWSIPGVKRNRKQVTSSLRHARARDYVRDCRAKWSDVTAV